MCHSTCIIETIKQYLLVACEQIMRRGINPIVFGIPPQSETTAPYAAFSERRKISLCHSSTCVTLDLLRDLHPCRKEELPLTLSPRDLQPVDRCGVLTRGSCDGGMFSVTIGCRTRASECRCLTVIQFSVRSPRCFLTFGTSMINSVESS